MPVANEELDALDRVSQAVASPITTQLYGDRYFSGDYSMANLTKEQDDFIAALNPLVAQRLTATIRDQSAEIERLRRLLAWQPMESAPEAKYVLACNALGFVGRAVKYGSHWNGIGKPTGWMPLPAAIAAQGGGAKS